MDTPIKTIKNVPDGKLEATCAELDKMGYMIVQRNRTGDEATGSWQLKAKLKYPSHKPNRELVD